MMLVDFSTQSAGSFAVRDQQEGVRFALETAAERACMSFPSGREIAIVEVRLIAKKQETPNGP